MVWHFLVWTVSGDYYLCVGTVVEVVVMVVVVVEVVVVVVVVVLIVGCGCFSLGSFSILAFWLCFWERVVVP